MKNEQTRTEQNGSEQTTNSAAVKEAQEVEEFYKEQALQAELEAIEVKKNYMPTLYVTRRSFLWKDEVKYAYELKAELRGRKLELELNPKDLGGYVALEIIFGKSRQLKLEITSSPYKDDFGRTKLNYVYEVHSEDGVLSCPLWPKDKSDGHLLAMLIAQSVADKKALEAANATN